MKKLLIIFLFIPFLSLSQLKYMPKSNGEIIKYKYYSLSYDEEHEQAEWVHYKLDSTMLKGKEKRENYRFKEDTKDSITSSSTDYDYQKYKYEKGHLAPFADMKMDSTSASESFYMFNISPQKKDFNRGEWRELEDNVRSLAKKNKLYITTGGVLKSGLNKIGKKNKVSVPEFFYKIIYDTKNEEMTAYLMPNKKLYSSFENYTVTVDLIEILTGIDFYHQLGDELEERLESVKNSLPAK